MRSAVDSDCSPGETLSLYIFQLLVAIGFDLPSRIRDESNVYALLTLRF